MLGTASPVGTVELFFGSMALCTAFVPRSRIRRLRDGCDCGTILEMDVEALQRTILAADAAVSHAQDVRKTYAKRTGRGDGQRQSDIQYALTRLKRVMVPIRAELARLPYQLRQAAPASETATKLTQHRVILAGASDSLQRERRKLWKMQERKTRRSKRAR